MRYLNLFTPCQVCNCARQFQDAVIGTGREIHLAHAQHNVAVRAWLSPVSSSLQNLRTSATRISALQTIALPRSRQSVPTDAGTQPGPVVEWSLTRLSQPIAGKFVVINTVNFDVDINAVEHRAGDAFLILGHGGGGTSAGFFVTSKISARAGIPAIE
jgi:hypothetical protein